jgi:threonine aldolase
LAATFIHRGKCAGHLLSKGRFFGAQFIGWLKDEHWLELARHANTQAALLAEQLSSMEGIRLVWPIQSNEIFITMPQGLYDFLQNTGAEFYDWSAEAMPRKIELPEDNILVRLVTSFATRNEQRSELLALIEQWSCR